MDIIKNTISRKPNLTYKAGDVYWYWMLTGKCFKNEKCIRFVECICTCGRVKFIMLKEVANNNSKSCGCRKAEIQQKNMTKHGMTLNGVKHPLYSAYYNMISRCYKDYNKEYKNYGDRGITVCDEWLNNFELFYNWAIGNNWVKGLSLERINNNKGYSPINCMWTTCVIQNRNKRTNNIIEAFGERKCLQDWATDPRCKVSYDSINHRMNILGWNAEKSITHYKMKRNGEPA